VVSDNTLTIKDIDKAPSRHVLLYVACLLGFHPAEAACCVASSKRHFLQRMYGEAGYPCSSTTVEPAPPSATKSWVPLTGTMRVVNPSRNQRALAWERRSVSEMAANDFDHVASVVVELDSRNATRSAIFLSKSKLTYLVVKRRVPVVGPAENKRAVASTDASSASGG
jgi:hypothetical protein